MTKHAATVVEKGDILLFRVEKGDILLFRRAMQAS